ncbi:APC family permease [Acidianus manzaensis]|uniref:Amino acid transporter n=1 Tax=Acidianus manzaensis TaxID=282676 RepID=A0A1W6JY66_9CREN|nr:APC family permease [Acidianus manzaensis]ARM75208.1 amino acid transporter [Acidianus manzaensis]
MPKGLKKNAVGFSELLGQSIALIAPLGAVAATLTGAAAFALGSLPLSYLIGIVAVLAWINVPYQFSKKIGNAGGFYDFASQGLGKKYGIYTGYIYLFSYFNVITNSIVFVGGVFIPSMLTEFFNVSLPSWIWIPILIVFLGLITLLAYKGIRPSLRYSLVTSVIEISLLIIMSIILIIKAGPRNSLEPFTPTPAGGWAPVFEGMILAVFSMSGSSGAVYLAEETKNPLKDVKKAVLISFLITGVVFVLTSYAMVISWGISNMSSFAPSGVPGLILADKYIGVPFLIILLIFMLNSFFAGSLAPLNSSARLLYALGRDKVAPEAFSNIHEKYSTPSTSILGLSVLSLIVSLISGLILGPYYGFLFLINLSAVSLFIGHMLGDVALPFFYKKIKEFSILYHLIAPIISFIILVFGIYYSFYPPTFPIDYSIIITVIYSIAILIMILSNKIRVVQ